MKTHEVQALQALRAFLTLQVLLMIKLPNVLLIAGSGTKSGKTTLACKIISSMQGEKVIAVKITPHFHETTPGLHMIEEGHGYSIYEETVHGNGKDSSRMLDAGASRVFYSKALDDSLPGVFMKIMSIVPPGAPVICESPALRQFVEPGVFIIVYADPKSKQKDIKYLQSLPHLRIQFEELMEMKELPVVFSEGSWRGKGGM